MKSLAQQSLICTQRARSPHNNHRNNSSFFLHEFLHPSPLCTLALYARARARARVTDRSPSIRGGVALRLARHTLSLSRAKQIPRTRFFLSRVYVSGPRSPPPVGVATRRGRTRKKTNVFRATCSLASDRPTADRVRAHARFAIRTNTDYTLSHARIPRKRSSSSSLSFARSRPGNR